MSRKSVVLLSGGLDSATVLALARAEGRDCYTMTFRYGQRHASEVKAARLVATALDAKEHKVVDIDLRTFGGSALTSDLDVPKDRSTQEMAGSIPITYVPARNTIFLSYALAWAEVLEADEIRIGVNAVDYSGYPDCRPEYIQAFERLANLATKRGVEGTPLRILAPLLLLSKAEIVAKGRELDAPLALTSSCYDPSDCGACGACDSCKIRLAAFAANGTQDPIRYAR